MFIKVKKNILCLTFIILMTSETLAENTKKAPLELTELTEKIIQSLKCDISDCDFHKIKNLYEQKLSIEESPYSRLSYAIILQHISQSEEEKLKAIKLEKKAINQILFGYAPHYSIQASLARTIASMYRSNIHFPSNKKKAKHWLSVAQSFEEKSLYRCNNENPLGPCWRSNPHISLCQEMKAFQNKPLPQFRNPHKEFDISDYSIGFLELHKKEEAPDYSKAIKHLARSFRKNEKETKSFAAQALYPFICFFGHSNLSTEEAMGINDPNIHHTNWLVSENRNDLSLAISYFKIHADNSALYLSIIAHAHLLGRGAVCDKNKALKWFAKIPNKSKTTQKLVTLIKTHDSTCFREAYLDNSLR